MDNFEFIASTGLSDLSRRDNKTQPGVSTPGTHRWRTALKGRQNRGSRTHLRSKYLRPFRARRDVRGFLGLKPQAESYYPFGIRSKIPFRDRNFLAAVHEIDFTSRCSFLPNCCCSNIIAAGLLNKTQPHQTATYASGSRVTRPGFWHRCC